MNQRYLAAALAVAVSAIGGVALHVLSSEEACSGLSTREPAPAADEASTATCQRAISMGEVCGPCIAAHCCSELDACYAVNECIDLNDCTVHCGEEEEDEHLDKKECRKKCAAKHPRALSLFRAWDACVLGHCKTKCPRPGPD